MKRRIYQDLLEWKNSKDRKPLVLEGARQVGKTYILKAFGQQEYENMIYINCHNNVFMNSLFEQDFNMERILRSLAAYANQVITPNKTLIFLDEVQDVPNCMASLKYFCEDAREQHVVAAGSLLGIMNRGGESYPVGKVNTLKLYPMSFEEFLWAKGELQMAELIANCDWETLNSLNAKLQDLLRQYYYVGGMPEVVLSFITENNIPKVRKLQNEILRNYDHDFAKHAGNDTQRIRMVWKSLPAQLAKENKKFIYGAIKKGGRAKEFETAIQWLIDAGLVYKISCCTTPSVPLSFYEDESVFKLFSLDIGLLGALSNTPPRLILINNDIFKEFKGSFTENYVLQQLKSNDCFGIYYFSKENSTQEIDFLIQNEENIIPIEVKAEVNVKSKSLHGFINDHADKHLKGLRFSMKPYEEQEWMVNVPLFAVFGYLRRMKNLSLFLLND